VQGASELPNTLERVKALTKHESFDYTNPNKIRALIGTFTRNLGCFHSLTGEGYRFLADTVIKIDAFNPEVAATRVQALTTWRSYDDKRNKLMRKELERILKEEKISKNLYEIVSLSLKEAKEENVPKKPIETSAPITQNRLFTAIKNVN